jgi:molybdopterin molybdotransferase
MMTSADEATRIILDTTQEFSAENVQLMESLGRVLSSPILADRDFPPFDRVTMDGIAISYSQFQSGRRHFQIEGIQAAGEVKKRLQDENKCLEIMTGAVLPFGTDTVIRYEDVKIENHHALIQTDKVRKEQNIHFKGEDRKMHDVLVTPGTLLSTAEIAVAATAGYASVPVNKLPSFVFISSGDELVDIDRPPLPHQIRKSNQYNIAAILAEYGVKPDFIHVNDDKLASERAIRQCLDQYDVILVSGGVSKGKFDYIPQALEETGVKKYFHKVSQRPGKPFWFGVHETAHSVVFALPGNPVSSFMCTVRYVIPWLRASLSLRPFENQFAQLAEHVRFLPDLTFFLPVKTKQNTNGLVMAFPQQGHGSGDLANMVFADGFLELPSGRTEFETGESFPLYSFRKCQ